MAIGTYGTVIPIFIPNNEIPSLVDISYCYHETREYDSISSGIFKKLSPSLLTPAKREKDEDYIDGFVEGMYSLQLPLSEFNKKGFYTVFIKPREIEAVITDVGNLTAFPNVRGLVLDTEQIHALPYIGKPTQKILLVNTLFEPIQLDIEMVSHNADTISYMLENNQLRDLDNGLVTTYNDNNAIYSQFEHYTLKDSYTGKAIYEVRKNRKNNINFGQTIEDKL